MKLKNLVKKYFEALKEREACGMRDPKAHECQKIVAELREQLEAICNTDTNQEGQ